jgi:hypothetical protein
MRNLTRTSNGLAVSAGTTLPARSLIGTPLKLS